METRQDRSIEEEIYIDKLTGLYNRRYFYSRIPAIIKKVKEDKRPLAILIMDVDHFKQVNDSFGHLAGDNLIRNIGAILKERTREGDFVARYAGDEFLAVLQDTKRLEAKKVAQRFRKGIDEYVFQQMKGQKSIHCTMSIGVSVFPEDGEDAETLISKADQALYSSKIGGRNKISDTEEILPEVIINAKLKTMFPPPKLIEREEVLAAAEEFLNTERHRQGGVLLFKGEVGMGKTAVLEELETRFKKEKDIICLDAKCSEQDLIQPYYRLLDVIRRYIQFIGDEAEKLIEGLSDEHKLVLLKFVPELKELLPTTLSKGEASNKPEGQILSEGLFDILLNASKEERLFITFDDMHWLDDKTLELLNRLAENDTRFISICGTYRKVLLSNTDGSPRPLSKLLDSFSPHSKHFKEIELVPLSQAGLLKLIELLFPGTELKKDLIEIIHRRTKGIPLVIEEIFRSLIETGLISFQEDKWFCKEIKDEDITQSLDKMILKRFENMEEDTKDVLRTAAIIGEGFDTKLLNRVFDKNESEVLELVSRARDAYLVNPLTPSGDERFAFTNQKIRDLIVKEIGKEKAAALHEKLAKAFEEEYGGEPEAVLCEIAYHYKMAENTAKASEFTSKITTLDNFPLEEAVDYFNKKFEEERKKQQAKVELDSAAMDILLSLLRNLQRTAINIRVYPLTSSVVRKGVDALHDDILAFFKKVERLVLTECQDALLINGQPVKPRVAKSMVVEKILQLMQRRSIEEITIQKAIGKNELLSFLNVLVHEAAKTDFQKELEKSSVKNVKIDKVKYGRIKGDEEALRRKVLESFLKKYVGGKFENLSEAEKRISKLLKSDSQEMARVITSALKTEEVDTKNIDVDQLVEKFSQGIMNMVKVLLPDTSDKWSQYNEVAENIIKGLTGPIKELLSQAKIDVDANLIQDKIRTKIEAYSERLKTNAERLASELINKIEGQYVPVIEALEREGREAMVPLIYLLRKAPLHNDPYNVYLIMRSIASLAERIGGDALHMLEEVLLLEDRWYVVRNVIEVLGYVKEGVSPEAIEPFLEYKSEAVREAAALALERMRGSLPPGSSFAPAERA